MSQADQIALNLLINAVCSFAAGSLLVAAALSLFRVGMGRWRIFLLSLPFLKIVWDLARGIPERSFLFTGLDPWALPEGHRSLSLGAGLSFFGPVLDLSLTALAPPGTEYAISLGDFAAAYLARVSPHLPRTLLGLMATVSLLLVLHRLGAFACFEWRRKQDERRRGRPAFSGEVFRVAGRAVRVYLSPTLSGTPFTGGWWSPYVCFPESTWERLTPEERRAVLLHELAHVRFRDLPVAVTIDLLGDVFWFVPGYRALARRIARVREVVADTEAVRLGASPPHLASALVRIGEVAPGKGRYLALVREPSLLKARVAYLLEPALRHRGERWGWGHPWGRWIFGMWIAGAVVAATFGGNHERVAASSSQWVPGWVR